MRGAVLVLVVFAGLSSQRAAAQQPRKLLQVSTSTTTPVNLNAVLSSPGSEPAVEAQTGPKTALAAYFKGLAKPQAVPGEQTTIVLPQSQPNYIPTSTTGAINVDTETPVNISSPVDVKTPQKNVKIDKIWGGMTDFDPTWLQVGNAFISNLIGLGSLVAQGATAGGTLTTGVGTILNTFLPDCPPPIDGADPIPGCEVDGNGRRSSIARSALTNVASRFLGSQRASSPSNAAAPATYTFPAESAASGGRH